MSRVVYKASCWDCQDFYYTGKTKQRLHDRKMEHFINPLRVSLSSWQDSFSSGYFFGSGAAIRGKRWSHEGIPTWILTLLTAPPPKQYSTPMLILPATHAGSLWVAIRPLLLPTMSHHKWDHFEILAKRTVRHPLQDKGDWLLIRDSQPSSKWKCQRWRTLPFFICVLFLLYANFSTICYLLFL